MYFWGRLTIFFNSPSFQAKPAMPADEIPTTTASTLSSQPASLSSDPAALFSTPGSSSRAQTLLADPATLPAPAPIPAPAPVSVAPTLTQDDSEGVSTTRTDTPAALGDGMASQDVSPDTPVASTIAVAPKSSTGPPASGQTPAVALKKPTRARRVGPKTVSDPEIPQTSASTRAARKTATNTTAKKATTSKEKTANTTKKAKTSKKVCPGR